MILLRTHVFGDREHAIMRELESWGGLPVAVAADESTRPLDVGPHEKLSVTRAACRRLGLFCPPDFAWRNGDYAFYLARKQFPAASHFWLIEPDVEHSYERYGDFFDGFRPRPEIDLLGTWLMPAGFDWYWRQNVAPRRSGVWRCLFSVIRLSARAVDACLATRIRNRWSLRDRLHWPNDEAFVATEVIARGFTAADLNDVDGRIYDLETFGYAPLDGAAAFRTEPGRLYHPVLYGEDYKTRVERHDTAVDGPAVRFRRRLQNRIGRARLTDDAAVL